MNKVRKVIRTGNSLAVTLPNKVIKSFCLKEGDLAQYRVRSSKASITYIFSGHPRQLTLGYVKK